jgi:hypothetical protein
MAAMQPHEAGAVDPMRHPLEAKFAAGGRVAMEEAQRLAQMRTTMGWAAAANRALTMQSLAGVGRMGGLPSSNILLRSYAGTACKLDVEDYLGRACNRPDVQPRPRAHFEHTFNGTPMTLPTSKAPEVM